MWAGADSLALAGTFTPGEELLAMARSLYATVQELLERTQVAAAVRAAALRRRYLELALQPLRAPGAAPLPGPAPAWEEIRDRWTA